ncbi:hypothetical protein QR680_012558 [Steinernema hermaphroditum]|uniref:Peptidase S72 domain-containing protein n=1 Tax=Steinernema hermaphroditum TaxID=289476 RepID=A0AA39M0Y1_9BILA|nr:hypothetical protein QR680_012558 [Steinernema hermaphroditum]
MASLARLLLILLVGAVHSKVDVRHLRENKRFISRFANGHFEIVQPMMEGGTVRLNNRLSLKVQRNDFSFANFEGVENCFFQGKIEGFDDSFVAISTGLISFENGTSYGIWPLNRSSDGKSASHVLYPTRLNSTIDNEKKAQKFRSKYINVELDIKETTDFEESTEKALFYLMDVANIADLISFRLMNVRLATWRSASSSADLKVTMAPAKALKKRERPSFIGNVCDVTGKIVEVHPVDASFTTHATAESLAAAVSDALGIPLNLQCPRENPFCLIGVVENRRCLHNYPPPSTERPLKTPEDTTKTSHENTVDSQGKPYHVDSATILIVMLAVGAFLFALLVVLHLTYRRHAPKETRPLKEVKVEAPRKRTITFAPTLPSYKSEQRRKSKNRRVFAALERTKTEHPKDPDAVSIASIQGSAVLCI